jgi:DNA-binding transcriptional LysR family regulator
MDRRDLEYFAVAAGAGSLTRASEMLGLSPAALSKSLRRLEAAVDAKLMERAPKGIALTNAGRLILARVEQLRLTLDDVKREAAEIGAGRAGELRIGMLQNDCERVTIACAALMAEAPKLTFELVVSNNDLMVPQLRSGKLDLVITHVPPGAPFEGTAREVLLHDEFVVCATSRHPLARRRRLAPAEVAEARWALPPNDFPPRQFLERAFQQHSLPQPKVALESRSVQVRLVAMTRSHLLGFLSRRLIRQAATRGLRLAELSVRELTCPVCVGVFTRKDGYLPRSAQRLIELLREAFTLN